MFTQKALITKWSLYTAALLLLIAAQQCLNLLSPIFGVLPFLMPIIIAIVAALEGPMPGTIFGVAVGCLCDLLGGGVFSGIYTFSFFWIALCIAIISKYWVMHSAFGSLIYAAIAFLILDVFQILYLLLWKHASLQIMLILAGKELLISILFAIPILFLFRYLHSLFRYD